MFRTTANGSSVHSCLAPKACPCSSSSSGSCSAVAVSALAASQIRAVADSAFFILSSTAQITILSVQPAYDQLSFTKVNLHPGWPKMAPGRPKMAPRWPKMAPDGPKMAPRWLKMAPGGPRKAQDGPKMAPGSTHLQPKLGRFGVQNCAFRISEALCFDFGSHLESEEVS